MQNMQILEKHDIIEIKGTVTWPFQLTDAERDGLIKVLEGLYPVLLSQLDPPAETPLFLGMLERLRELHG